MSGYLKNKIAVLTGAGRGLGRSIAISYGTNGAKYAAYQEVRT